MQITLDKEAIQIIEIAIVDCGGPEGLDLLSKSVMQVFNARKFTEGLDMISKDKDGSRCIFELVAIALGITYTFMSEKAKEKENQIERVKENENSEGTN